MRHRVEVDILQWVILCHKIYFICVLWFWLSFIVLPTFSLSTVPNPIEKANENNFILKGSLPVAASKSFWFISFGYMIRKETTRANVLGENWVIHWQYWIDEAIFFSLKNNRKELFPNPQSFTLEIFHSEWKKISTKIVYKKD